MHWNTTWAENEILLVLAGIIFDQALLDK